MKKREILQRYNVDKLDETTVFIRNQYFSFSYTIADSIVKEEFKGKHRYFGGLQCPYRDDSPEYKNLEHWLCEIAEFVLFV